MTNYTGESREYLKKLITAMGAQFTPSMSGRNTVLIAAQCVSLMSLSLGPVNYIISSSISGTKATKARNWSIPIVNHTWLEDCFVQWRNLTVGLEKYIIFPPGMDFSQMLGERGVGKAMLDDADLELELECAREGEAEAEVRAGDKIPVGTEASAMDAKEVEGVVGLFDDEDNVLMNAAIAPTDGDSGTMQLKAKSKPKPASKLSKPDSKKKGMALEDGAMSEDIQRTPRKHASPLNGSRVQEPSESDDTRNRNDDGIGLLHVPRRGGRHMTDVSPTREGQKGQVKSRPEEEAAVAEVQGEPRSSTRKRKDPPASEDDDDLEMEVEVQPKKRAATRTKARAWTDTDDEDITRQATTVGPTAGGSKGKGKATIDATPSVTISSPANRVPTPKRVLSVLMPTLASVLSPSKPLLRAPPKGATAGPSPRNAPQRTESICVTANEASSSKRVRLAAASPSSSIRMVTPSATSTPVLAYASGKRSAATKATQRLHEVVMPDVLNYQQEMRKSSKAKGRDRATDGSRDIDVSSRSRKKRTPDVQSASSSDEEDRRRKKPRVSLGSGKRTKIAALSVEGDDSEGPFKSNKRRITSDNEEGEIHKPAHKIGKSRGDTKPIKLMTTQVTLSDDVIKVRIDLWKLYSLG